VDKAHEGSLERGFQLGGYLRWWVARDALGKGIDECAREFEAQHPYPGLFNGARVRVFKSGRGITWSIKCLTSARIMTSKCSDLKRVIHMKGTSPALSVRLRVLESYHQRWGSARESCLTTTHHALSTASLRPQPSMNAPLPPKQQSFP